jgi:hypothetical protein
MTPIQQLSSGHGSKKLVLQMTVRITSKWICLCKTCRFVDETGFTLNRNVKSQNNRYSCYKNPLQFMISVCTECIQNFRAHVFLRNSNNAQTVSSYISRFGIVGGRGTLKIKLMWTIHILCKKRKTTPELKLLIFQDKQSIV